jgi:hypothetical protein
MVADDKHKYEVEAIDCRPCNPSEHEPVLAAIARRNPKALRQRRAHRENHLPTALDAGLKVDVALAHLDICNTLFLQVLRAIACLHD